MNHLVVLTHVVHLEHELWKYMEGNTYKYISSIAKPQCRWIVGWGEEEIIIIPVFILRDIFMDFGVSCHAITLA